MCALTAIDIFAGAGGATAGLREAGFEILAAVEVDADAAATYRANHTSVWVEERDICAIDPAALRQQLELGRGDLSLLKACPPCQGFSSLGSTDPGDPRNELVAQVWRFVDEFEPRAVLMENVPALRRDPRFDDLRDRLVDRGYALGTWLVNASDFGVPQSRRRLILLGVKGVDNDRIGEGLANLLPAEFDCQPPELATVLASVGVLGGPDPVHRARSLRPATQRRVESVPIGGNRFDLPDDQQLDCHKKVPGRNATSSYGRMKADGIAPTMTTRCTTPACGSFIHPTENRGISLREAALIQTFPLDYSFVGSYCSIERQIGNAVPVRMAFALGLVVRSVLADGVELP